MIKNEVRRVLSALWQSIWNGSRAKLVGLLAEETSPAASSMTEENCSYEEGASDGERSSDEENAHVL